MENYHLVDIVTENTMDGDDLLERKLNAYLTKQFVLGSDVPSDECLEEARKVIAMVREYDRKS